MNRFPQFAALSATLLILSGCSTVTDMVTSNLPESYSGRASIVVSLHAQEAYLYRGGGKKAWPPHTLGRRGERHPGGGLPFLRYDERHSSRIHRCYLGYSRRIG